MTNKRKHKHGHPTPHPVLDLVPTTQRNPEIKKKNRRKQIHWKYTTKQVYNFESLLLFPIQHEKKER